VAEEEWRTDAQAVASQQLQDSPTGTTLNQLLLRHHSPRVEWAVQESHKISFIQPG